MGDAVGVGRNPPLRSGRRWMNVGSLVRRPALCRGATERKASSSPNPNENFGPGMGLTRPCPRSWRSAEEAGVGTQWGPGGAGHFSRSFGFSVLCGPSIAHTGSRPGAAAMRAGGLPTWETGNKDAVVRVGGVSRQVRKQRPPLWGTESAGRASAASGARQPRYTQSKAETALSDQGRPAGRLQFRVLPWLGWAL